MHPFISTLIAFFTVTLAVPPITNLLKVRYFTYPPISIEYDGIFRLVVMFLMYPVFNSFFISYVIFYVKKALLKIISNQNTLDILGLSFVMMFVGFIRQETAFFVPIPLAPILVRYITWLIANDENINKVWGVNFLYYSLS